MGMFFRPETFIALPMLFLAFLPWILGFTYVRVDADRHGQPGGLWALLTLPLGWFAILGYVIVRSLNPHGGR